MCRYMRWCGGRGGEWDSAGCSGALANFRQRERSHVVREVVWGLDKVCGVVCEKGIWEIFVVIGFYCFWCYVLQLIKYSVPLIKIN